MTTEILKLDEIVASQAQKEVPHNTALRQIEGWIRALSITTTAPPGTPAAGDTYIVPAGATGAWAGQDNKLAHYYGGSWKFRTPPKGVRTFVLDEDLEYVFNSAGAWVANGGDFLTPEDADAAYEATGAAAAAVAAHQEASDPHPQYLTQTEADIRYTAADGGITYTNFGPSGAGHASGLVPDPGATAGTTKYLREDGTWQAPPGTGNTSALGQLQFFRPPSPAVFTQTFDAAGSAATVYYQSDTGYTLDKRTIPSSGEAVSFRGKAVPSGQYTATTRIKIYSRGGLYCRSGISLTDGTKFYVFGFDYVNGGLRNMILFKYTNVSTFGSGGSLSDQVKVGSMEEIFLRIRDNGTNLYFEFSIDGGKWVTAFQEARTAYLTPAYIGLACANFNASGANLGDGLVCSYWSDPDYAA